MSDFVRLVEVGPRDGLQNEQKTVDVVTRIELVQRLAEAGLRDIEVGAFVSPKWVPQMAGSDEVLKAVLPEGERRYWSLVPNLRGYEDAVKAGARRVAVFTAASETFSRKNTNSSLDESLERIAEVLAVAKVPVRGYVSCALGCPYEGEIAPAAVARVAGELFRLGCEEVSIGDTIGKGTPETTQMLFDVLLKEFPAEKLAAHFHDTYGNALANLDVVLDRGVRIIDSSVAGLGGCPYAPGAKGNVATGAVLDLCARHGFATGVDAAKLAETAGWIREKLSS